MLVYKDCISKKGNHYYKIYYQFKSGKRYGLTMPYIIVRLLIESKNVEVKEVK